ncbi:hypothetical protein [Methanoplanus limicola]|uniref:Uncharacterized protein n=1 Tax=Methanoplanus limicola DSM 2279 TaxID=937775 RepID=H1YWN1_9EURY|nr:hypothetical protein [Methanoplanus limicola]EHQ36772.1 hypothetical protein Metlim_2737 [Methanoplanus limicola DSM 2279]
MWDNFDFGHNITFFLLDSTTPVSSSNDETNLSDNRVASHFLTIFNITSGEFTISNPHLSANPTREDLKNEGYRIIIINETFIKERSALFRAFENDGLSPIYQEERNETFALQGAILDYNGSLYHALIGST